MTAALEPYIPAFCLAISALLVIGTAELARPGRAPYDPVEHVELRYISPEEQIQIAFNRESLLVAEDLVDRYTAVWQIIRADAQSAIETACAEAADTILGYDGYFSRASTVITRSKDELVAEITADLDEIHATHIASLMEANVAALNEVETSYHVALRTTGASFPIELEPGFPDDDIQDQRFIDSLSSFWSFGRKISEDGFELVPYFGTAYGLSRVVYDNRTEAEIVQPFRSYCEQALKTSMNEFGEQLRSAYGNPGVNQARFAAHWTPTHALDTK